MTIYFYTTNGEYGCFSNFSAHGFELYGKNWPTAEHCFQAQKFRGTPHTDNVRKASSPGNAKRLAWSKNASIRKDWDHMRDEIMREIVLRKFETHEDIRETLLSTGTERIVENSPRDGYWGAGSDGSGKNMLGRILMEVRSILQKREEPSGSKREPG